MKRKLALYFVTAAAAVGWFHFAATLSLGGDAVWSLFFSRVSVPALLLAAGRAIEAVT